MKQEKWQCLVALRELTYSGERYSNFEPIIDATGLPRPVVRRHIRALARAGLAEYGRGLWTEWGDPGGAGYTITEKGVEALKAGKVE